MVADVKQNTLLLRTYTAKVMDNFYEQGSYPSTLTSKILVERVMQQI